MHAHLAIQIALADGTAMGVRPSPHDARWSTTWTGGGVELRFDDELVGYFEGALFIDDRRASCRPTAAPRQPRDAPVRRMTQRASARAAHR